MAGGGFGFDRWGKNTPLLTVFLLFFQGYDRAALGTDRVPPPRRRLSQVTYAPLHLRSGTDRVPPPGRRISQSATPRYICVRAPIGYRRLEGGSPSQLRPATSAFGTDRVPPPGRRLSRVTYAPLHLRSAPIGYRRLEGGSPESERTGQPFPLVENNVHKRHKWHKYKYRDKNICDICDL